MRHILTFFLLSLFVSSHAQRAGLPGTMAVDADLYDVNGEKHHFADFRGKTVVVQFTGQNSVANTWSTSDMWHYFADSKVDSAYVLISVSSKKYKNWVEDVKRENVPWLCLNDKKEQNGIFAQYNIQTTPTIFIISPDGKIEYRCKGYDVNFFFSQAKQRNLAQPKYYDFGGGIIVTNPENDKTSFLIRDHIRKITVSPANTRIDFFTFLNESSRKALDPTTTSYSLITADGQEYKMIQSEGVSQNQKAAVGGKYYALIFEPLPMGVTRFDIRGTNAQGVAEKLYKSVIVRADTLQVDIIR